MKIFTSIWMVIAFAVVLTGVRIDNSDTVKTLRYKTWDHFQYVHPRQEVSDTIVVVAGMPFGIVGTTNSMRVVTL